jgi:hypothetical protein
MRKSHDQRSQSLVKTVLVLFVELPMIGDTDLANLEKVELDRLRRLSGQLDEDERVGLDVRDQLFLLLKNVLEVLDIVFRVLLLLELLDEFVLAEVNQALEILQKHLLRQKHFDGLGENTDGLDGRNELDVVVRIIENLLKLLHDLPKNVFVNSFIDGQAI